jgi:hypothetical protein
MIIEALEKHETWTLLAFKRKMELGMTNDIIKHN